MDPGPGGCSRARAAGHLDRRCGGHCPGYGYFYGPGSAYAEDGLVAGLVRKRQFPVAGSGFGVFSFVHMDDAAAATVALLLTAAASPPRLAEM